MVADNDREVVPPAQAPRPVVTGDQFVPLKSDDCSSTKVMAEATDVIKDFLKAKLVHDSGQTSDDGFGG